MASKKSRISPRWLRLRHRAEYVVVRFFLCVIQALSLKQCQQLAYFLGWLASEVLKIRDGITQKNLLHAFPEATEKQRRKLSRQMWRHLILLVFEIAQLQRKVRETTWRRYVRLKNVRVLMEAMISDRAVVIGSAHFGNFELAGYVLGLFGFPTYSVARKLDNPYLDAWLNEFRGKKGQRMIPKKGGAEQIAEVLSNKGTMALLADQHAGPKGCWVDFFGRPASAHKAVAVFTISHDAPLVVGYAQRLSERALDYELCVTHVIDPRSGGDEVSNVRKLTQFYTNCWEEIIRRAPEQYWWLHDRWREPPQRAMQKRAA